MQTSFKDPYEQKISMHTGDVKELKDDRTRTYSYGTSIPYAEVNMMV